jgi:hypothetical protein
MNLLILRNSTLSDANGTFGNLLIDGEPFCATCEQPWNNNLQNHSCIPEGDYELRPYDSPAHGPTVVFHNPELGIFATPDLIPAGISGRSLCEIHNANWPFQVRGCVAVGVTVQNIPPSGRGVTNSVVTFHKLISRCGTRSNLTATIRRSGSSSPPLIS